MVSKIYDKRDDFNYEICNLNDTLPLQREVILCYIGLVDSRVTLGLPTHGLNDLTSQLSELIQLLIGE